MRYKVLGAGICCIATFLIISFHSDSYAFVPGGFKALGTGGKSHKEITTDALDTVYASYGYGPLGTVPLSKPMKEAREQITDANASVDDNHPNESAWHCAASI